MRTASLIAALLVSSSALAAQDRTIQIRPSEDQLDPRQLPRDAAMAIIELYNQPGTMHFSGRTRVPPLRTLEGDVVILGGPVSIGGRVTGDLVVVNGDLELEPGARLDGDVMVAGGIIRGAAEATIAGEIMTWREILRYRREGDELVYAPEREVLPRWARRFRRENDGRQSTSEFFTALGGTYNRVEGVPIVFGPRVNLWLNDGMRFQGDLFGIVRSGRNFAVDEGEFGYRLRGEFLFGARNQNLGVGARAWDQVNSTETWPLKDYEAGWGAFLLHRDYRDFYRRRGASLYAVLRSDRTTWLQFEGREERHYTMDARDPWTIFRSDQPWRANPAITDGVYRSAVVSFRFDRRNDRANPSHGVYLTGEFEAGRGTGITGAIDPLIVCVTAPCQPGDYDDGKLDYRRGFVDARSYVRVAQGGRLGLRVAGGGRLGGELLPVQRRVSLGGPDPLPGYSFRQMSCGGAGVAGTPALCDRVLLGQIEYRTHFGIDIGPDWVNDWGDDEDDYEPFHVSGPDIVVFADAGRAWNVGTGPGEIPSDRIPSFSTFIADIGLGLDFGPLGFYLAKGIGSAGAGREVTFTVRMGRRF